MTSLLVPPWGDFRDVSAKDDRYLTCPFIYALALSFFFFFTLIASSFIGWDLVNSLRPRQNGRHFADDTFKRIFMNENVRIAINISLKFVPKGLINNIPALVQIMAWHRPGDKPLSETMMVNLLTHISVTRPQWVKLIEAEWPMYISNLAINGSDNGLSPGWPQVIIWTNAGIMLIGPLGRNFSEILIEIHTFSSKKMHVKISTAKWRPFCCGLNMLNMDRKWGAGQTRSTSVDIVLT